MGPLPFQRQIQVIFRAPASRMPCTRVTNAEVTLSHRQRWALERTLGLLPVLRVPVLPLSGRVTLSHHLSICACFPTCKTEAMTPTTPTSPDCCDSSKRERV